MCRGVLGLSRLDSAPPDYSALLTKQSKQSSRLSLSNMSSSPLPPAPLPSTTTPRPDSQPDCFSLLYKSWGIYVLEFMHSGKPGKWKRAAEQADMSPFGQECNEERGERGVCWIRRGGGRETSVSTFLSPFSPSSFSFSSYGRQQPGRQERDLKKNKKKRYRSRGDGRV